MKLGLEGKTAIVTGASRGIGLAVVRALREEGMQVVAGARNVSDELRAATPLARSVDLATESGPGELVEQALGEFGSIDLLVNNVGGVKPRPGFLSIDEADWKESFELNFYSTMRVTKAALPSIIERQGSIVNIGSINSRLPLPQTPDYCAAKAAVANLSKALAEEFGPAGVRVNTVSPGPVLTDIWTEPGGVGASIAQQTNIPLDELASQVPAMIGLSTGQMTRTEEVAALVVFLASRLAGNISGSDLVIDGGNLKTL